jgi:phenylpropionate dioxygenase-like ring-hydroxylating dioxygenase large terminal subunit
MNSPAFPGAASAAREWPAEGPSRAPYWVFTDEAVYEAEQARIFRGRTWSYVGLEAEVPNPGDYKTTWIGNAPVILCRDEHGTLRAMVNRCAHRGNLVCLEPFGNAKELYCVYHAWIYDLQGDLKSAAFRRGVRGQGGLPADFDPANHGLQKLAVATFCGLVFASFAPDMPPIEEWLGEVGDGIRRVLRKPLQVLGYDTQRLSANWKNYHENPRDGVHANILHTFYGTFGQSRVSQDSGMVIDAGGRHQYFYTKVGTDRASADYKETAETLRSHNDAYKLEDRSLLQWTDEFGDGINIQILSVYPSFVLHQISNSIATRQVVPLSSSRTDLVWTYVGFADDSPELRDMRLAHTNMVGSAGLVSMEDGAVCEMIRRAAPSGSDRASFIEMGGKDLVTGGNSKLSERGIRNFWNTYRRQMGL